MGADAIRVLVVDDHLAFRSSLRKTLANDPRITVAGEAENGSIAVTMVGAFRPDVVLMDIEMPVMSGIVATGIIVSKFPATKVIALTIHADTEHSRYALQAGACHFLAKGCGRDEILDAIKQCCLGTKG